MTFLLKIVFRLKNRSERDYKNLVLYKNRPVQTTYIYKLKNISGTFLGILKGLIG